LSIAGHGAKETSALDDQSLDRALDDLDSGMGKLAFDCAFEPPPIRLDPRTSHCASFA